jgi:hypothetical protein
VITAIYPGHYEICGIYKRAIYQLSRGSLYHVFRKIIEDAKKYPTKGNHKAMNPCLDLKQ